MEGNKKKRKISELIGLYELSKAALPPPLEAPKDELEQDPSGAWVPKKRSKLVEDDMENVELPPLPSDEKSASRKKLKSTNSRPKLSTLSTSERRLRDRQRCEAANEILTSEKNYVATLESFMTVRLKRRFFKNFVGDPLATICFGRSLLVRLRTGKLSVGSYP